MDYCKFPNCVKPTQKTWALVPICDEHRDEIKTETDRYYNGSSAKSEEIQRPLYFQIHLLVPWSKANLKVGDRK